MPWGGEGTKGSTDQKEGFYGGPELNPEDDHPLKGMPTYGKNQFPDEDVPEMRKVELEYIEKVRCSCVGNNKISSYFKKANNM